jgi:hypothetical protein
MYRLYLSAVVAAAVVATAQAGPQEFFNESVKDFGITPRGPVLVHYFAVKNTSNQAVTIGQPRVSCGCVSASILKATLQPGESTAVLAQMDTRRIPQAGALKSVTVYVPFLTPTSEEVHLRVQAIARDDLVLTPDTLAFGTVKKGAGAKATVKLTFYSDPNWTVTEPTSTGAYIKATVKAGEKSGNTVSYDVEATLDPECPVGSWTADVWVKTSAVGIEKFRIPVSVVVSAPIASNPEAVKFGDVKVGQSSEQRLMLQGNSAFKILKINGADDLLTAIPMADDSRPVHVLKLTLSPKAAGDVARTIEVETDHKEQPKITISLVARGVAK